MNDQIYMKRCIELASKALGKTYPNPMVGAIIVLDDEIIGEGFHHKAGEPHAEINAINSVKNPDLLPLSTIYVSLEPCAHYGKTPPCALKIKELGFKRVVIGCLDSHDKVNGKGKKILTDAGIVVLSGVLDEECRELNRRFFTYHEKKRPYIILKWAQSSDNYLDKDFQPVQISNAITSQMVHQLRADEQAILIGTNTALHDNPSLTVRNIHGKNPIRVLIDMNLKVPKSFNIFNKDSNTIVFNGMKDEKHEQVEYIKLNAENILDQILEKLYHRNIISIIIEGGGYTLQQFIDKNYWDEAMLITNATLKLTQGSPAPKLAKLPLKTQNFNNCSIDYYRNY